MSASVMPVALSKARWGERSNPFLILSERIVYPPIVFWAKNKKRPPILLGGLGLRLPVVFSGVCVSHLAFSIPTENWFSIRTRTKIIIMTIRDRALLAIILFFFLEYTFIFPGRASIQLNRIGLQDVI